MTAARTILAQHTATEANPPWRVTETQHWPGFTALLVEVAAEFDLAEADDRIQLHQIANAVLDALLRAQPSFVAKVRADAVALGGGSR